MVAGSCIASEPIAAPATDQLVVARSAGQPVRTFATEQASARLTRRGARSPTIGVRASPTPNAVPSTPGTDEIATATRPDHIRATARDDDIEAATALQPIRPVGPHKGGGLTLASRSTPARSA